MAKKKKPVNSAARRKAPAKRTTNKESTKSNPKQPRILREVMAILLLVAGLLFFLGVFFTNSSGVFGGLTSGFTMGILGYICAHILPFILVGFAVLAFIGKPKSEFSRFMIFAAVMMILLSAIFAVGEYSSFLYSRNSVAPIQFVDWIKMIYADGANTFAGGLIGTGIAALFMLVFGMVGTYIVLVFAMLIATLFFTGIPIREIFDNIVGIFKNHKAREFDEAKPNEDEVEIQINGIYSPHNKGVSDIMSESVDFSKDKKDKTEIKDNLFAPNEKFDKFFSTYNLDENKPANLGEELDSPINPRLINISKSPRERYAEKREAREAKEKPEEVNKTEDSQMPEYIFPPINLLNAGKPSAKNTKDHEALAMKDKDKLESALRSFGVEASVVKISRGPTVTRFELKPGPGVKVSKINSLADDIALNMKSDSVRIEAPIPGKGVVGIELGNKEKTSVLLKEVIDTQEFREAKSELTVVLGKNISGDIVLADIHEMPHMLIAGATGSGKSVCINTIIISILYKSSPEDVRLLMVDPKMVELGVYKGIPHLYAPVVTDPKKAANLLGWACAEMDNRYNIFAEAGVRDIKGYNALAARSVDKEKVPAVVIIIDELADLMMVAPRDVEDKICRLAQKARAAGMHLIVATQRPSVDVITGLIKANIPSRIAFSVSSQIDSRTIIDSMGAEKLLGKGDMLYWPLGMSKPFRVQGALVTDKEVENVVNFVRNDNEQYNENIIKHINKEDDDMGKDGKSDRMIGDEYLNSAIDAVIDMGHASTSMIQRKFGIGYARAGRIIDQMYERGIIGPYAGSKPREVLITKMHWQEMQARSSENMYGGPIQTELADRQVIIEEQEEPEYIEEIEFPRDIDE